MKPAGEGWDMAEECSVQNLKKEKHNVEHVDAWKYVNIHLFLVISHEILGTKFMMTNNNWLMIRPWRIMPA